MGNNRLKHSIQILEYAFILLEEKAKEGLKELSLLRKPDNVVYLKHLNNDDNLGMYTLMACQSIPSLILMSFTIELTLKLLIKQETNKEFRGHDLKKLFEALPIEFKDEIISQTMLDLNIDLENFNEKLKDNNTVFIDLRYSYESLVPNSTSTSFLLVFYKRLKEKIK